MTKESIKKQTSRLSGFTIVELLIVIVVIGILAAITIVAFNGVQNKAKVASLQSDTQNAVKSLELFKAESGTSQYPLTSTQANLKASANNSISYTGYTASDGYCVQTANTSGGSTLSYYATNVTQLKQGTCTPITNIVTNPSLETATTGWSPQWFGSGGDGTTTRTTSAAKCGAYGYRKQWTVSGAFQDIGFSYIQPTMTADKTYTFNVSQRSSFTTASRFWVDWRNSSNVSLGSTTSTPSFLTVYPMSPNIWKEMTFVATAPGGTASAAIVWGPYPYSGDPGYGAAIPVGATLDTDCLLITESTSDKAYGDGASPNWGWTGTPHSSTSTGPAL